MADAFRELTFTAVLALAVGVPMAAYVLGVLIDPIPAAAVAIALVAAGAVVLIPRGDRSTGAIVGVTAVGLAGVAIPRSVAGLAIAADELAVTSALAGVVLLGAVSVLRMTVFARSGEHSP